MLITKKDCIRFYILFYIIVKKYVHICYLKTNLFREKYKIQREIHDLKIKLYFKALSKELM